MFYPSVSGFSPSLFQPSTTRVNNHHHHQPPPTFQGAQHLRDVFHRMGFNDKEIVCLSGAHTLGRCHKTRSGFDGPWTTNPLQFDNNYFRLLSTMTWQKRQWDGPEQYEDQETKKLMMLPTDMALMTDPKFKPHVLHYAADEESFFDDFSDVFAKLTSLGCPFDNDAPVKKVALSTIAQNSAEFREYAMHGSVDRMQEIYATGRVDPYALEATSRRSALHKAAFWGHILTINFLIYEVRMDLNQQDYNGDTAMHDAARFGHVDVVAALLKGGGNPTIKNAKDENVIELALKQDKFDVAKVILESQLSKM